MIFGSTLAAMRSMTWLQSTRRIWKDWSCT